MSCVRTARSGLAVCIGKQQGIGGMVYIYRSMVGGLCKEVTLSVRGEMAVFLSSVAQTIIMPCCFWL